MSRGAHLHSTGCRTPEQSVLAGRSRTHSAASVRVGCAKRGSQHRWPCQKGCLEAPHVEARTMKWGAVEGPQVVREKGCETLPTLAGARSRRNSPSICSRGGRRGRGSGKKLHCVALNVRGVPGLGIERARNLDRVVLP